MGSESLDLRRRRGRFRPCGRSAERINTVYRLYTMALSLNSPPSARKIRESPVPRGALRNKTIESAVHESSVAKHNEGENWEIHQPPVVCCYHSSPSCMRVPRFPYPGLAEIGCAYPGLPGFAWIWTRFRFCQVLPGLVFFCAPSARDVEDFFYYLPAFQ